MSSHATSSHAGHDEHVGHVLPLWLLAAVLGVLLFLTVLTVAVTQFDFGREINLWIALVIAVIKSALVVFFFMHLGFDRLFNTVVFLATMFFVALFLGFAMMDSKEYKPNQDAYIQKVQPPEIPASMAAPPAAH